SQWFVLGPGGGRLLATFGAPNLFDVPVPGDYDGLGRAQPAVFRPSTAQWFARESTGGRLVGSFGQTSFLDVPHQTSAGSLARPGRAPPGALGPRAFAAGNGNGAGARAISTLPPPPTAYRDPVSSPMRGGAGVEVLGPWFAPTDGQPTSTPSAPHRRRGAREAAWLAALEQFEAEPRATSA